mgnify:FL=1|tara:strand:- start:78 stop:509 length:432 start_codon:yes stop_codon:yes gene_type:complete
MSIKSNAIVIRDETTTNANTAVRVGGNLVEIADQLVVLETEKLRKAEHNIVSASTTQTINLSTTISINIIRVLNPGLTLTLQLPTNPVENQICEFTTLTNTVTLIVGTGGSFSVDPTYAGAPTAGFKATYVYHIEDTSWYLMG